MEKLPFRAEQSLSDIVYCTAVDYWTGIRVISFVRESNYYYFLSCQSLNYFNTNLEVL